MEFIKCFFLFIELMLVIHSSYSYIPRRTYVLNRNRVSSIIPRQCETPVLKNGSVRLRQRGKLIRYICLPPFTLMGDQYSSCIQGQWENPVPMCIRSGCPVALTPENGFTIVERNGAVTMLFCQPGYSVAGSQETFCNGTAWDRSLGSCRETQASPAMSCDFEVNTICDWEADSSHDFEWVRKNGYTTVKLMQSGPNHDNTIGVPLEGHFMLATFASQSPHSVARLISPLYPAEARKDACFRFYYHMYGAITGELRVYIKPKTVSIQDMLDTAKYLFLEKNGSYENAWLESVFDIDQYDQDFQIVIEATAVRTTRSNIAIDDVALLRGADCLNEESKSTGVTEEDDGIFDAQSCATRCQETEPYSGYVTETTITSSNKTVNILHCDCYDGCVDRKSCCLDYRSTCVFDVSTMDAISSESTTEMPSSTKTVLVPTTFMSTPTITSTSTLRSVTTVPTTPAIPTTKAITTTKAILTTKGTMKTSPTPKTMPTTKTVPSPTTVTTSTPVPTTVKVTSKVTAAPTETTIATTLKRTTEKATPRTSSTPITTTKKTAIDFVTKSSTPTVPITSTTKYTEAPHTTFSTKSTERNMRKESDDEWHPVDTLPDTDPLPTNLLYVFGIMILIGVIFAFAITSFRFYQKHHSDRFNHKTNSKRYFGDSASDEVRFLTPEEQLDFTMER